MGQGSGTSRWGQVLGQGLLAVLRGDSGAGVSPGGLPAARCMRDSAWLWLMGRSTWDSARMRGLYTCRRL